MAAYNEKMPQVAETESAETGSDRQRNPRTFILVIFLLAIYRQGFFFLTLSDPSSASPRNEREREREIAGLLQKRQRKTWFRHINFWLLISAVLLTYSHT